MKTIKYIFSKAAFSSLSGWPIAFSANLIFLPSFAEMLTTNPVGAAISIGVLFGVISIIRLFIIDYVEDRYGLNIKPDHLYKRICGK